MKMQLVFIITIILCSLGIFIGAMFLGDITDARLIKEQQQQQDISAVLSSKLLTPGVAFAEIVNAAQFTVDTPGTSQERIQEAAAYLGRYIVSLETEVKSLREQIAKANVARITESAPISPPAESSPNDKGQVLGNGKNVSGDS